MFVARPPTLCLILVVLLHPDESFLAQGAINIPSSITRLLGMSTDVSIEFTRFAKFGNFLSQIGLLGPFALGLLSKAGLAIGIMGTAATAISFAARDAGSRTDFYDRNYYNYLPYDHFSQHRRRRRSLLYPYRSVMRIPPANSASSEDVLEAVQRSDVSHCGERLICELASKPRYHLMHDELLILDLFKSEKKISRRTFYEAKYPYIKALISGRRGRSCSTIYNLCPFSSTQMMSFIRLVGDEYVKVMK